ncbi:MAG: hypothetical protein U9R00_01435 [Patescibacteria group bacterium]|nr:hypothetical protein [Patescibacteria group bacterium]
MYQSRNKKKNNLRNFLIAILLFVLFIFISQSSNFFHKIGFSFWKIERNVDSALTDSSHIFRTKSSVFKENDYLKNKVFNLESKTMDYELIEAENEELKELLGRISEKSNFVLGAVLVKPSRTVYDSIIIDLGLNDGLVGGEKVFTKAIIPIGEVAEVYEKTSLVSLYSNPGKRTEAVISDFNINVELIGRGGGNFETIIPLDLELERGIFLVLPGLKSRIIAVVEGDLSNPTDSMKKILLRSPINIQEIKWVQVLK